MTIRGTTFSEKPEGSDGDINAPERGRPLNGITWTATEIQVSGARCRGAVTVNTIFGSKTIQQRFTALQISRFRKTYGLLIIIKHKPLTGKIERFYHVRWVEAQDVML